MAMKFSKTALVVALMVVLAFAAIVARWMIVADLAEDVDTHRLSADEEKVLLVKRAQQEEAKKQNQPEGTLP
jgi:sensor domain CHASE-containing protein